MPWPLFVNQPNSRQTRGKLSTVVGDLPRHKITTKIQRCPAPLPRRNITMITHKAKQALQFNIFPINDFSHSSLLPTIPRIYTVSSLTKKKDSQKSLKISIRP